jgi:hypothetical protein
MTLDAILVSVFRSDKLLPKTAGDRDYDTRSYPGETYRI